MFRHMEELDLQNKQKLNKIIKERNFLNEVVHVRNTYKLKKSLLKSIKNEF